MDLYRLHQSDPQAFIQVISTGIGYNEERRLCQKAIENNDTYVFDLLQQHSLLYRRESIFNEFYHQCVEQKNYPYINHILPYAKDQAKEFLMVRALHRFDEQSTILFDTILPHTNMNNDIHWGCYEVFANQNSENTLFDHILDHFLDAPIDPKIKQNSFMRSVNFLKTPMRDLLMHKTKNLFFDLHDEQKIDCMRFMMMSEYEQFLISVLPECNHIDLLKNDIKNAQDILYDVLPAGTTQKYLAQMDHIVISKDMNGEHPSRTRKM